MRSIIIENDLKSERFLSNLIKKHIPNISIVGKAATIKDAISLIQALKPELIFLDIELDDGLCFEILKVVDTSSFEVIFITAYDAYYKRAIAHYAFSYILKPFDAETLMKVINRYYLIKERHYEESKFLHFREFLKETNSKILLHVNESHISVAINDIFSCHSAGNYTKIHLNDKEVLVSKRLKHYEELLGHKGFFRVNRTSLINTNQISHIYKKETVILNNNRRIHVSYRNRPLLSQLINTLS